MARIGWYVLFLIAAVFYFLLASLAQTKQRGILASRKGSVFVSNQLTILTGLVPIVLIPWILTGFFSRSFVLFILAAFEISAFLTFISYYFFRLTPMNVGKRYALWGGELGLTHPFLFLIPTVILALGGLVGYFCFATYVYFANPLHSENAVRQILLLNLGLYVASTLIVLSINSAQLASSHIDDRTRRGLFLAQATTALQTGLVLTLYLGLMGIGTERFLPASLAVPATYLQYIPLGVLTALYLLILVIPYFAGLENRRRAETTVYKAILDLLNKIIDAVGIPDEHDLDQLNELRDDFVRETSEWIESEPIVRELATKIDRPGQAGDSVPTQLKPLVEPYRAVKGEDLRFVRLAWTDDMKAKFEEIIEQYKQYASQPDRVQKYITLAEPLGAYLRDQRQRYETKLKEADERKVLAPVLARLVPTLGAVPVVWQYGHKMIAFLPFKH